VKKFFREGRGNPQWSISRRSAHRAAGRDDEGKVQEKDVRMSPQGREKSRKENLVVERGGQVQPRRGSTGVKNKTPALLVLRRQLKRRSDDRETGSKGLAEPTRLNRGGGGYKI